MNKKKIFIACDTTDLKKVKKIIAQSRSNEMMIGYKFGLEFMNSKKGREFISKLRNKITFIDLKLNDTVHTMLSAVKALKDLKINYLTVHISSGLAALKAVKKRKMLPLAATTVVSCTFIHASQIKQVGCWVLQFYCMASQGTSNPLVSRPAYFFGLCV